MDPERLPDPTSLIAAERVQPGPPTVTFWVALSLVGAAIFLVLVGVGLHPAEATASEQAAARGSLFGLVERFGPEGARIVSAAAVAVAAMATALAGRRLLHSDGAGILAAVTLTLDPGTLAIGRLALPDAVALAGLAGALACFLSLRQGLHWAGAGFLALAALAEPLSVLWGIPLALMALLRGHIYAAPRHLGESLLKGVAIPGAAALVAWAAFAGGAHCAPALQMLTLSVVPVHGPVAIAPNALLWLGGLGALAVLSFVVFLSMGRQVRIARLPGRVQLRLPDALHPMAGRILWLALLALLAPLPAAWMLVAALALAAGVVWLSEDAPGFGLAVALVVVGFGILGLVRAWPLVTGLATPEQLADLADLLPWSRTVACGP